jgi:alkaline phosphatase D
MPQPKIPHDVAAGEVTQTSALLWARSLETGRVRFQWSTDPGFRQQVEQGSVVVSDPTLPAKLAVQHLKPGTTYHYGVVLPSGAKDAGTFETPAALGQHKGLTFGVTGDWRGELAPYPAIKNVPRTKPDLFVLLGDTIYADYPSPAVPADQAKTLAQYRAKHAEVLSKRFGQDSWADLRDGTAVLATIDDHEVTDDFAGGAPTASDPRFAKFKAARINDTKLYDNGLKAFLDYNPVATVRYGATGDARTAGELKLYRTQAYGSDAQVTLLDARSFRDQELKPADLGNPADVARFVARSFVPGRTLLGRVQLEDLKADLQKAERQGITWKFVMVPEPIQNLGLLVAEDRYEGYAAERTELLKFIHDHHIDNVVFVSADIHGTLVNNLTYQDGPGQPQVAAGAI